MDIKKLFRNLDRFSTLVEYLFIHRDKEVDIYEIEDLNITSDFLYILQNYEIIDYIDDKITLDGRVIQFIESYLNIGLNSEISLINENIADLKHIIDLAKEAKKNRLKFIQQIKRGLKRIDFILFQNIQNLRYRIDIAYKGTDDFEIKIKELKYYKEKLNDFILALKELDIFLSTYKATFTSFFDNDLIKISQILRQTSLDINKSLIYLTSEVINYINKSIKQGKIIEKISKLKVLRDNKEIEKATNINKILYSFDIKDTPLRVSKRLDDEIINSEEFVKVLKKISSKIDIKTKKAKNLDIKTNYKIEVDTININSLHLEFSSSKEELIKFLLLHSKLKDKPMGEVIQVFCKMLLLYDDEYKIEDDFTIIKDKVDKVNFKKVFYGS